jgi:hypothetical protein
MNVKERFNQLKNWIDGNQNDQLIEINKAQISKSEAFLQRISSAVDVVLQDEIVRLPTGNAYIPNGFIVYLNSIDDSLLRTDKREFFEQNLAQLMLERAKELAGTAQISTKLIKIQIKIDVTLRVDQIDVKVISTEIGETIKFSYSTKKSVEIHPKKPLKIPAKTLEPPKIVDLSQLETIEDDSNVGKKIDDFSTIDDEDFKPLYWLEVWNAGKRIYNFPIINPEIIIGRDYENSKAHIRLKTDDRKIGGLHASLKVDENGEIKVLALHKNYTNVGENRLSLREGFQREVKIDKNGEFMIYDFGFRLKV